MELAEVGKGQVAISSTTFILLGLGLPDVFPPATSAATCVRLGFMGELASPVAVSAQILVWTSISHHYLLLHKFDVHRLLFL